MQRVNSSAVIMTLDGKEMMITTEFNCQKIFFKTVENVGNFFFLAQQKYSNAMECRN
jgi:hypothetical protein